MKMQNYGVLVMVCLTIFFGASVAAASTTANSGENQWKLRAVDIAGSTISKPGDKVRFETMETAKLAQGGSIPAGTQVLADIIEVKRAGGWGCPGKCILLFKEIKDAEGKLVPLGKKLKISGAKPNFFVQFSLLGGLIKGKQANINPGDVFILSFI